MKLRILEQAWKDLKDGVKFYQKQEAYLGEYFLSSLISDIETLRLHAGIHPVVHKSTYRLLSKRFPFAIYYLIQEDTVIVKAVLDCRKNPSWIRKRLSKG